VLKQFLPLLPPSPPLAKNNFCSKAIPSFNLSFLFLIIPLNSPEKVQHVVFRLPNRQQNPAATAFSLSLEGQP
jgi:hypothetical protein